MKKIVYSIVALILAFLLNIGLYFYSESYSFFLKKLKYGDNLIENESKNITDEYTIKQINNTCTCESVKYLNCQSSTGQTAQVISSSGNIDLKSTKTLSGELNELFTHFDKII